MNSRLVSIGLVCLLVVALLVTERSIRRSNAGLRAQLSELQEQMRIVRVEVSQQQGATLRAENERLRGENQRLQAAATGNPGTSPRYSVQQASLATTPAYDPLAFYRRNPELMKRYFPQLYNAQMAQKQNGGEVPAGPKE